MMFRSMGWDKVAREHMYRERKRGPRTEPRASQPVEGLWRGRGTSNGSKEMGEEQESVECREPEEETVG